MERKIHVANRTKQNIGVWVTPDLRFVIASLAVDVAKVGKNFSAIGTVTEAYAMLQAMNNVKGFIDDMKRLEEMLQMIVIKPGDFAEVYQRSITVQSAMKPDMWQEIRGKATAALLIQDSSERRSVAFESNTDHSWIVEERGVRRAEFGSIWKAGGDFHRWHYGRFYIEHTTSAAPSLVTIGDRLHCYLRHDGGNAILHLVLNGVRWEKAEPWSTGIDQTSDGPCVVSAGAGALLFFRTGPHLKVSEGDGFTFRTNAVYTGLEIDGQPSAARLGDLTCVTGMQHMASPMIGIASPMPIVFATTRGGPFATGRTNFQTRFSPSLCVFRDALHLYYTDEQGRVMHSTSKNGTDWSNPNATKVKSSRGSTVVEWNGAIHMLYRDPNGNGIFYARSNDGFQFAAIEDPYFGYDLNHAPAAAIYQDQVHLMGQDAGGTGLMWAMPRLEL